MTEIEQVIEARELLAKHAYGSAQAARYLSGDWDCAAEFRAVLEALSRNIQDTGASLRDRAATPSEPSPAVSGIAVIPSAVRLSDIRVGDEIETYIEGGWRMEDGQRVERERDRSRVTSIYWPPKHGEYELGVADLGEAEETGLIRLTEVTKVIPASGIETEGGNEVPARSAESPAREAGDAMQAAQDKGGE